MRAVTVTIAIAAVITSGASAQKLETQTLNTNKVVRVETAKDHLTVIELGDPVMMVAIGNQNAFTVERRENKVFVKPTDEESRTNLLIWTTAGRYAYELVPAPNVEQMHFAIDQLPSAIAKSTPPESESNAAARTLQLPDEMLTKATPILLYGERNSAGRVEVALRDLYRKDDRIYVRFVVLNHTARPYQPSRPAAYQFGNVKTTFSLIPLAGQQLGERAVRSLKTDSAAQLEVIASDQAPVIEPGGQGVGWLVVKEPNTSAAEVCVLRLNFAADSKGSVDAHLVLHRSNGRQEVAHGRPAGE
jgi:hypothetical protein